MGAVFPLVAFHQGVSYKCFLSVRTENERATSRRLSAVRPLRCVVNFQRRDQFFERAMNYTPSISAGLFQLDALPVTATSLAPSFEFA